MKFWDLVGQDGEGKTTYKVKVDHIENRITTLGQFSLASDGPLQDCSVSIVASGKTQSGRALDDSQRILVFIDLPAETPMQPV